MASPKMICPNCSAEMNHHAMKVDYGEDFADEAEVVVYGGSLKEVHTCPQCDHIELRKI